MLILSAGLRYRHLSETRVAVCLIPGPVFVLCSIHRTNTGEKIGQTTNNISDIGRCPKGGDGIIVVGADDRYGVKI